MDDAGIEARVSLRYLFFYAHAVGMAVAQPNGFEINSSGNCIAGSTAYF